MRISQNLTFLIFLFACFTNTYAVDVPSTLIVTGTISSGGGVSATKNDLILAVQPGSKTVVEGTGSVLDGSGNFSLTISKTTDFNGTDLTLIVKKKTDGAQHQLNEGTDPVLFQHAGSLFPAQINLSLKVGVKLINGQPAVDNTGGGSGSVNGSDDASDDDASDVDSTPSAGSPFDVNNDGLVNQQDIDLVKASVVTGGYDPVMDVNKDLIVNTRDIIETTKVVIANRIAGNPDN